MSRGETNAPDTIPTLPRGSVIICYALLGGVLVYVLVARYFLPLYVPEPISIQHASAGTQPVGDLAETLAVDDRIDPNTATWTELTRLPGIGEVTAKRIVAYRQEHAAGPGQPVFRAAEDLSRVKGIGPKTVENIRERLKFGNGAENDVP
jgi:competence protein ComEA